MSNPHQHRVELTCCVACWSPEREQTAKGFVCALCRSAQYTIIEFDTPLLQDAWYEAQQQAINHQRSQAWEAISSLPHDYDVLDVQRLCASLPIPIAQAVRKRLEAFQNLRDEEDTITRLGPNWE